MRSLAGVDLYNRDQSKIPAAQGKLPVQDCG
jgi:hypothetical protein